MRPSPDEVQRITVVGAGTMGHAIAQVFAQAGIHVDLVDLDETALARAPGLVEANLRVLVDGGRLNPEEIPAVLGRLHPTTSLAEAAGRAEFAMEVVSETIAAKQAVVNAFEDAAGSDVVLASNTSALDLFAQVTAARPERFVCGPLVHAPVHRPAGGGRRRARLVWRVARVDRRPAPADREAAARDEAVRDRLHRQQDHDGDGRRGGGTDGRTAPRRWRTSTSR